MKLLITLVLVSVLNCCSHKIEYVPLDFSFYRLIESHLICENLREFKKEEKELKKKVEKEIDKIKANNADACDMIPQYRDLEKCKKNRKKIKKIKRRQERKSWWMIW